jgi:hypothetical protein
VPEYDRLPCSDRHRMWTHFRQPLYRTIDHFFRELFCLGEFSS